MSTEKLYDWYKIHKRALPWREEKSVYGVWLSEVLLQQTQMERGKEKWYLFMKVFPTVSALAQASIDEVLQLWEGLGYYSRARNLHKTAILIHQQGSFPSTYEQWLKMHGIGPYTAAAISSIVYQENVAVVDGNVQRVISRYFGDTQPVDTTLGKKMIQQYADGLLLEHDPGMHNQAMMEVGALICKPKQPKCIECPLQSSCFSAFNPSLFSQLPKKHKKIKPIPLALHWHIVLWEDNLVVKQQSENELWSLLYCFSEREPIGFRLVREVKEPIQHQLTHRSIKLTASVWRAPSKEKLDKYLKQIEGVVVSIDLLDEIAKPVIVKKLLDKVNVNAY